jgi:hypothetical protein
MFAHLKEHEASKVDNPRSVDLSPECCSMLEKLMLAQAQVSIGEDQGCRRGCEACLNQPTVLSARPQGIINVSGWLSACTLCGFAFLVPKAMLVCVAK